MHFCPQLAGSGMREETASVFLRHHPTQRKRIEMFWFTFSPVFQSPASASFWPNLAGSKLASASEKQSRAGKR